MRESLFHNFRMTWSRFSVDLEKILMVQKKFAQAVCSALDRHYNSDNDLISCFEILSPTNMS